MNSLLESIDHVLISVYQHNSEADLLRSCLLRLRANVQGDDREFDDLLAELQANATRVGKGE
jgi:hypothetical protein